MRLSQKEGRLNMFIRYNGRIYGTKGFYTGTHDWNCDGDVYTDTVMNCFNASGSLIVLHKYDSYQIVPESEVMPEDLARLEKFR